MNLYDSNASIQGFDARIPDGEVAVVTFLPRPSKCHALNYLTQIGYNMSVGHNALCPNCRYTLTPMAAGGIRRCGKLKAQLHLDATA